MTDRSTPAMPAHPALHPKPDEVPGSELPQAVYRSVVAAFAWMSRRESISASSLMRNELPFSRWPYGSVIFLACCGFRNPPAAVAHVTTAGVPRARRTKERARGFCC